MSNDTGCFRQFATVFDDIAREPERALPEIARRLVRHGGESATFAPDEHEYF